MISITRRCTKCGEVKPLEPDFPRYYPTNPDEPCRWRSKCNACTSAASRAYQQTEQGKQTKAKKEIRYRATTKSPTPEQILILNELWGEIRTADCHCVICDGPYADTWAHSTQPSVGGTNELDEYAPTHGNCNNRQASRTIAEQKIWDASFVEEAEALERRRVALEACFTAP